jgi:hypothetical protein
MTDQGRRARREKLVIEHMQIENEQEWDRTMATFGRARRELPDGSVVDGTRDVVQYWLDGRSLVPDQRNELIELTHLDDGQVQVKFWLRGSPTGGGTFELLLWAVSSFGEDELLVAERVYGNEPSAEQIAGQVNPARQVVETNR